MRVCLLFCAALAACTTPTPDLHIPGPNELQAGIVPMPSPPDSQGPWGEFYGHYMGETPSARNVLAGVVDLRPGTTNHPPHRHAEEEFLMVVSGTGTWTTDGETRPAREGDMLYAPPWTFHGLAASDNGPLRFVVFKYNSRGLPMPADPDPARGEFGILASQKVGR